MFPSEEEDTEQAISNVVSPHQDVGKLEVQWIPLADEDDDGSKPPPGGFRSSGSHWQAMELHDQNQRSIAANQMCKSAYCQYDFYNETYTTETVEAETNSPVFDYEFVHHIDAVTEDFIDYLQKPFHINVFVTPYISNPPSDKISTNNDHVVAAITGKKPSLEGKDKEIRETQEGVG